MKQKIGNGREPCRFCKHCGQPQLLGTQCDGVNCEHTAAVRILLTNTLADHTLQHT
jgi:hypothetical protein